MFLCTVRQMQLENTKPFVIMIDHERHHVSSLTYYFEEWEAAKEIVDQTHVLGHILCSDGKIITIYISKF
jgi:hypothetical protein